MLNPFMRYIFERKFIVGRCNLACRCESSSQKANNHFAFDVKAPFACDLPHFFVSRLVWKGLRVHPITAIQFSITIRQTVQLTPNQPERLLCPVPESSSILQTDSSLISLGCNPSSLVTEPEPEQRIPQCLAVSIPAGPPAWIKHSPRGGDKTVKTRKRGCWGFRWAIKQNKSLPVRVCLYWVGVQMCVTRR